MAVPPGQLDDARHGVSVLKWSLAEGGEHFGVGEQLLPAGNGRLKLVLPLSRSTLLMTSSTGTVSLATLARKSAFW